VAQIYQERFAYDADKNMIYRGANTIYAATEGDASWYIWKYVWADSNLTKISGPVIGSWDGRETLF
jgi:hypothetical protein